MSELKLGDRVEYIGYECQNMIKVGDKGTIVSVDDNFVGVDFDRNIYGHDCKGCGRDEHCWYVSFKYLKKIEETKEESKVDTLEQKILTALREEIGVEIGEEFEVYQSGERQWTCRFDKNGFARITDKGNSVSFDESWVWKYIVSNFHKYKFKRKPFAPECGEDYFFLAPEYDEIKGLNFRALQSTWIGSSIDYGMLAVGNIFRTEEEALKRKDKLLEKLEKLRKAK